jgi:CRP/FNR family transcriptional regulator
MTQNKLFNIDGCQTCGHKLCAKKVSLFSNLTDGQIHTVVSLIERKSYKKGETILHIGDDFDRLYIVNHGSLKATTYSEEGKEQILYILNEGDSLGELTLLQKEPSSYDLIALKDVYLCTIAKHRFDDFVKENSEVMFSIMASVKEKIQSLEKLVGAIASNDGDYRLKFLINRLIKQSGENHSGGIIINLQLTREDMANFVGVTRETISRKLSYLTDQKIIKSLENKKLLVLDPSYFEA